MWRMRGRPPPPPLLLRVRHPTQRQHPAVRDAVGHRRRGATGRVLRDAALHRAAAPAAPVLRRPPRRPGRAAPRRDHSRHARGARRLRRAPARGADRGHDRQRRLRGQGHVGSPARPRGPHQVAARLRAPADGGGARVPFPRRALRAGAQARQGGPGGVAVEGGADAPLARRRGAGTRRRAVLQPAGDRAPGRPAHRAGTGVVERAAHDRAAAAADRLRGVRPRARRQRRRRALAARHRRRRGAGRARDDHARPVRRALARVDRALRGRRAGGGGMSAVAVDLRLTELQALEAEAIHVMREVAGEFDKPVLLFSGGKDSIVLLRLAEKAFRPARFPFPLLHVDTGHNFPEVIDFRDRRVAGLGEELLVASVQESIDAGRVREEPGANPSRNRLQTVTLLDALAEHGFDAAFGGARRDEERSRAKERILSFRDELGQWEPQRQRPEVWNLYNGRIRRGEHARVFPISNWTELDVWQYIAEEELEVPSIYFAHEREVFARDGMLYAVSPFVELMRDEAPFASRVRYRTVGDMSCTGAVESSASTLSEVVAEIAATEMTERGQTRGDDRVTEAAMEDRKRQGYF